MVTKYFITENITFPTHNAASQALWKVGAMLNSQVETLSMNTFDWPF